jgi:predicted peroxiredoxin
MRINYQFAMASGLCSMELDVMVRDQLFYVTTGGYESPKGSGEQLEAALLDFADNFKRAGVKDLVDGRIRRNLPRSADAE